MRTRTTLAACGVALAFAMGLYAQEDDPRTWPIAVGRVVSLNKEAKTLTVMTRSTNGRDAGEFVLAFTDKTTVFRVEGNEVKPSTLDEVRKDAHVQVLYKPGRPSVKPLAASIVITRPAPAT
jgi:hypothetical protein